MVPATGRESDTQMRKLWVCGLFGALVAYGAAVSAQDTKFYVGASGGLSKARSACDFRGLPAGSTVNSCDNTDTGWKVYGGYQWTSHWGFELGYYDFGKASASATVLGVPVTAHGEATGWQLAATGTLPITPEFDVFAKLGIHNSDVDVRASAPGVSVSASGNSTDLAWGLGAKWNFTRNVSMRIEYERFNDVGDSNNTGKTDIDLLSIGVMFRF